MTTSLKSIKEEVREIEGTNEGGEEEKEEEKDIDETTVESKIKGKEYTLIKTEGTKSTKATNSSTNTPSKKRTRASFESHSSSLSNSNNNENQQLRNILQKSLLENPPIVHLSSKDSAPPPQLNIMQDRLSFRGGLRGYRMSRASHGVSSGNYFYEVLVEEPPSARDVVAALPSNIRLNPEIKNQLESQLKYEDYCNSNTSTATTTTTSQTKKRQRRATTFGSFLTGHLRLGWSMRTGELQAPVGYDRWSYAIRDIQGSRIHNSKRDDRWSTNNEGFYPNDIIGIAICLSAEKSTADKKNNTNNNHIRFFKNGQAMGQFIVSRHFRSGGAAFDNIESGTYYPAISAYMGGSGRVNFGPYFTYPIHGAQLPTGMKLRPMSEVCPPPLQPDVVLANALKEKGFTKKNSTENFVNQFKEEVLLEAKLRYEYYQDFIKKHIEFVKLSRTERGLTVNDLPTLEKDLHSDQD